MFSWPSVSTHPLSYLAFHYDLILLLIFVHLISFEFLSWIPILALVIWISEFNHNYFCFCNFAYFLMSQSFLISNGIQGRQINARSLTRPLWVWNEIFQYLVWHFCFSKSYLYAPNIHSYVKSPEIVFRFNNILTLRI